MGGAVDETPETSLPDIGGGGGADEVTDGGGADPWLPDSPPMGVEAGSGFSAKTAGRPRRSSSLLLLRRWWRCPRGSWSRRRPRWCRLPLAFLHPDRSQPMETEANVMDGGDSVNYNTVI